MANGPHVPTLDLFKAQNFDQVRQSETNAANIFTSHNSKPPSSIDAHHVKANAVPDDELLF